MENTAKYCFYINYINYTYLIYTALLKKMASESVVLKSLFSFTLTLNLAELIQTHSVGIIKTKIQ